MPLQQGKESHVLVLASFTSFHTDKCVVLMLWTRLLTTLAHLYNPNWLAEDVKSSWQVWVRHDATKKASQAW